MSAAPSILLIERIVPFCCRWPASVALAALVLTIGAGAYTNAHFAMNTDSEKLISADVGWRQREIQFDRQFPQQSNLTLVVIDGKTPELGEGGGGRAPATRA